MPSATPPPPQSRAAAAACAFCCVRTLLAKRNAVVYRDARVFGMEDHNPRAATHLLVVPHEHIPHVDALAPEHAELLGHMIATGKELLAQRGVVDPSQFQLGFHRPPFASVQHLHLHCLGFPFVPSWNRLRFTPSFLGSYVDAERVLAALQRDASGS
ncbi:hypothetical protein PybrP1_011569 [[Pythium] brassicae (nom. inval.)]|nr:hypothetical protein PybrP1_011569 [[Pythium] brassicae (nom. inval.)]